MIISKVILSKSNCPSPCCKDEDIRLKFATVFKFHPILHELLNLAPAFELNLSICDELASSGVCRDVITSGHTPPMKGTEMR
jgi:hypothetical protein